MQNSGTLSSLWNLLNKPLFQGSVTTSASRRTRTAVRSEATAGKFSLDGPVRRSREGMYSINDVEFAIDANTWIIGKFEVGKYARVSGVFRTVGKLATRIVVAEERG